MSSRSSRSSSILNSAISLHTSANQADWEADKADREWD
eukprot:CAMPEP_0114122102 /NCGR_PEP_ID=MMETSP0043_2-20121206/7518_1 /TAXON_ID=464988 /ORGANISM="Hemiselmis andersenii, Strain CCMP644" /LENGTH=37 /DNA_ID= /DNA_START= /DNA_END= /DNA_ORIENTATION=